MASSHLPASETVVNTVHNVISSAGTEQFPEILLRATNEFLPVDHLAVLIYSEGGGPHICFTHGTYSNDTAKNIAAEYEEQCERDPYFQQLVNLPKRAKGKTIHVPLDDIEDAEYVERFYKRINIVDKGSIFSAIGKYKLMSSFYRLAPSEPFNNHDWEIFEAVALLLAGCIVTHARLIGMLPVDPSGTDKKTDTSMMVHTIVKREDELFGSLSDRERDICERIVLGQKTSDIAQDLGIAESSVITYRKRSYAKLGVSSHQELFSLFLQALNP